MEMINDKFDQKVKVISIFDHEYIYIHIQNCIHIYESIKFNLIEKIYLEFPIKSFEIIEKNLSLIILTHSKTSYFIHLFQTQTNVFKDYKINFNYALKEKKEIERVENISISPLGDVLLSIDKAKILKFYSTRTLDVVSKSRIESNLDFPFDYFKITNDTKNIMICSLGNWKEFIVLYKSSDSSNFIEDGGNKLMTLRVPIKHNILSLKEIRKDISAYARYENNSIFFILTENLDFLAMRKLIDNETPGFVVIFYLDLKFTKGDKISTFDILSHNLNKYYLPYKFDTRIEETFESIQTYLINPDNFQRFLHDTDITNIESFDLTNFKNIPVDYIIFCIKADIYIYKAEGFKIHPMSSVNIELMSKLIDRNVYIHLKKNSNNEYRIINFIKGYEQKLFIYFIDKSFLISKCYVDPVKLFIIKDNIKAGLFENDRFIKVPVSLSGMHFIPMSKKILLLEYSQSNNNCESYLYVSNKDYVVKKAIYFPMKIDIVGIVFDSNFIYFSYNESIILMNIRTKLFAMPLYILKKKDLDKLIVMNLKEITLENENKILKLSFNNLKIIKRLEKIVVEVGIVTDKYIIISDLMIELNNTLSEKEFVFMNTLKKFEKIPKALIPGFKFLILPGDENQKVLCFNKENNLIKITDCLNNNKLVFTLLIEDEEVIFCNDFLKEGKLFLLILTPILVILIDLSEKICYRNKHNLPLNKDANFKVDVQLCFKTVYVFILFLNQLKLINFDLNFKEINKIKVEIKEKFVLSKDNNLLIDLKQNIINFNEEQVENLFNVTKSDLKSIVLKHASQRSIYDIDTFYDYLLSNNIQCVKIILSIFSNEPDDSKNIITLLNLDEDILRKLILDFNIAIDISSFERKDLYENQKDSAHLQKAFSISGPNSNVLNIYPHIKSVYEQIYNEMYSSCDHITKYFNVKFNLTKQNFQETFKLPTSDLCWITLIHDQEFLIKSIFKDQSRITWKLFKMYCIPIWIKNDFRLKELLEIVARNEYKILKSEIITEIKSFAEHVSLYYYLAGKMHVLLDLLDKEKNMGNIRTFLTKDFKDEKVKKSARNNGLELKKQKRYIFSIFFFLLGGDITTAIDVALRDLLDINLAVLILKLYPDTKLTEKKVTQVFQEYFVNFGLLLRDPWLTISGYIFMKKIDSAMEYILNYTRNYQIDKDLLNNVDEYNDYIAVIKNVFHICQFEYRILIFGKNLEKIYRTLLDEQKKNTKSQQNTNFDDIWGDEFDDFGDGSNEPTPSTSLIKDISIQYNNICLLSVVDCMNRNNIFNPTYCFSKEFSYFNENSLVKNIFLRLLTNRMCSELISLRKKVADIYSSDVMKSCSKLINDIENDLKVTKDRIYAEIIEELIQCNEYDLCYLVINDCSKSKQEVLQSIYKKMDEILKKELIQLIEMSNTNIHKLSELETYVEIIEKINNFISMVLKSDSCIDLISTNDQKNIKDNLDVKTKLQLSEKNIFIFRIYVMIILFFMIVFKIFDYFDRIRTATETLSNFISDYKKEKYSEKFSHIVELINNFVKISKSKINKEIKSIETNTNEENDVNTIYFKNILHFCFIKKLNEDILAHHLEIATFSYPGKKQKESLYKTESLKENFKIIGIIISINQQYIKKFQDILESYLKANADIQTIFDLHEELKIIYLKNYSQDSNFYKFSFIKIKNLFKHHELLKDYETYFNVKEYISQSLNRICRMIMYERGTEDKRVTKESVKIINQLLKNGLEIVLFNETFRIHDFSINNCDNSKMSVALLQQGHKRINILNNMLKRKRTDDYLKLTEYEGTMSDENKQDVDYGQLINNLLQTKYNEVYPLILENFPQGKTNKFFEPIDKIPPYIFNEIPLDLHLEELNPPIYNNSNFCSLVVSHPLLPIYLTTNNKGVIHTWSYQGESKSAIDEFYVEKSNKENINKVKTLKKLKFNHYGNEFFVLDDIGNLLFFKFDHNKLFKTPILSLWSSNAKSSRDARYINNSGLVASTANRNKLHTTVWDFLLPLNQSNVMEFDNGGNIVTSYNSSPTLLVGNEKPGSVSFLDFRRNSVISSFQAHLDEIKQICISERENFMITLGKDAYVKIWDITFNKVDPLLVESFQPFPMQGQNKKVHLHMELVNNNLFVSSDNCIKLLRTKLI